MPFRRNNFVIALSRYLPSSSLASHQYHHNIVSGKIIFHLNRKIAELFTIYFCAAVSPLPAQPAQCNPVMSLTSQDMISFTPLHLLVRVDWPPAALLHSKARYYEHKYLKHWRMSCLCCVFSLSNVTTCQNSHFLSDYWNSFWST